MTKEHIDLILNILAECDDKVSEVYLSADEWTDELLEHIYETYPEVHSAGYSEDLQTGEIGIVSEVYPIGATIKPDGKAS